VHQRYGFARIFAPDGAPLGNTLQETEEGLVTADIDLGVISLAKSAADPVGHYSRPDVTRLLLNRLPSERVVTHIPQSTVISAPSKSPEAFVPNAT
jgi:aliphatic nitrilase